LGCGFNKAKYAGKMKYCTEHGLDFEIYKLGPIKNRKTTRWAQLRDDVAKLKNDRQLNLNIRL